MQEKPVINCKADILVLSDYIETLCGKLLTEAWEACLLRRMCAICLAITCDGLEKLLNIVKHLAISLKMYDTRKHFIYCGSYEDELRSIESTGYSA